MPNSPIPHRSGRDLAAAGGGCVRPPLAGPLYPNVVVRLSGSDGNAYAILGGVSKALRAAGIDPADFLAEAKSGDYSNVLATAFRYVDVA